MQGFILKWHCRIVADQFPKLLYCCLAGLMHAIGREVDLFPELADSIAVLDDFRSWNDRIRMSLLFIVCSQIQDILHILVFQSPEFFFIQMIKTAGTEKDPFSDLPAIF